MSGLAAEDAAVPIPDVHISVRAHGDGEFNGVVEVDRFADERDPFVYLEVIDHSHEDGSTISAVVVLTASEAQIVADALHRAFARGEGIGEAS